MRTEFTTYLRQGKSNNYLIAEDNGKLKAGEAAKILSKKFGTKILAKEIECFSSEYHHAGVFRGFNGQLTGKKVKFFRPEQLENITLDVILRNRQFTAVKKEEGQQLIKGWFVTFEQVKINHYGKLAYKPFVALYTGTKEKQPKNFTPLSDEQFEDAKNYEGKQLQPYASHYYLVK